MKQKMYNIYSLLNKKYYTISFIFGTVVLFFAIFTITFLPLIIKHCYRPIDNNIYRVAEFILLFISSILYVFSYRHYQKQLVVIMFMIMFYVAFAKLYIFFV